MTSPRHAESTALGRYYTHPSTGEQLISVTNALSVGCAKPALVPWAAKIVAEKSWDALPRMVAAMLAKDCGAGPRRDEACGRCRDCLTRELKGEVTVARDKAADLGSRIHALAEAHVLGAQLAYEDGDEEAHPFVDQYVRFLKDFNVDIERDIESAELTVANPRLGYAGTLDLLVRLPFAGYIEDKIVPAEGDERGLFLVDLKTSRTRAATSIYGEYALQLAALRHATETWLPDDTQGRMPRIHGAAVLNLRQRTYELLPVPTGSKEFDAFKGSLALAKWMHGTGKDIAAGDFRPIGPSGRAKPKRARTRATTSTTGKAA